ncbi:MULTISPECIES: hypothetical protein [unclassified Paenibacillus]|uniref:hypothetical protein n=1 Tax=unclassified Paenibacillus TaxID=185978 RepID=UPI002787F42C|nr:MULTISPECIES: hypothetical protein [unclassified Paenibacillus]MDQ0896300.1 hypothetical protein [Paenibacillus sp. V4I7]MDQ0913772.1 hypothetical protein [Paenibacillus sp. V4I5]
MSSPAIYNVMEHWNREFERQSNLDLYDPGKQFAAVPQKFIKHFRLELFPQPFYGYLTEDMTDDVFMPLLNPGPVKEKHVTDLFNGYPYPDAKRLWNEVIRDRHTRGWSKAEFHERESHYDKVLGPRHWRLKKMNQVKSLIGDAGFLHTIEFFPFHSDRWKSGYVAREDWFRDLISTQLAIGLMEDISARRLVKHILGIGLSWAHVLESFPETFIMEGEPVFLMGQKGKVGHRIFKFKPVHHPDGLPIVIYSGSSMDLPIHKPEVVERLRAALEI